MHPTRTLARTLTAATLSFALLSCGQLSTPPVTYTTFIYAAPQACPALEVSRLIVAFITGKTTPETIVLSEPASGSAARGRFPETSTWDTKAEVWPQFQVSCQGQPLIQGSVQIHIPDRTGETNNAYEGHVVTIIDDASQPGRLRFSVTGNP